MPMFIKMGLNGTGYLGKKENALRQARRCAARRKILPGFPVNDPFHSIDDVRNYLEGDKIICLLCGKGLRKLGAHIIKIHGMTINEYKKKYKIPWGYGLACTESSELYRINAVRRMEEGWTPALKFGDEQKLMVQKQRRACPFKKEIAMKNLGEYLEPKHELTVSPSGDYETLTQKRERERSKRGTEEYSKRMRARPQCQPDVSGKRFGRYWRGRKQTPEHIRKRFEKQA